MDRRGIRPPPTSLRHSRIALAQYRVAVRRRMYSLSSSRRFRLKALGWIKTIARLAWQVFLFPVVMGVGRLLASDMVNWLTRLFVRQRLLQHAYTAMTLSALESHGR
jgi:hypothetical protein